MPGLYVLFLNKFYEYNRNQALYWLIFVCFYWSYWNICRSFNTVHMCSRLYLQVFKNVYWVIFMWAIFWSIHQIMSEKRPGKAMWHSRKHSFADLRSLKMFGRKVSPQMLTKIVVRRKLTKFPEYIYTRTLC